MNGQNIYMKYLAFYEYSFKTDSGNQDISIFYKITHPGKSQPLIFILMLLDADIFIHSCPTYLYFRQSSSKLEECV